MADTVGIFADRIDAGRRLADRLAPYARFAPVVVALPRGGVPVGAEVARRLGAPLDVLVVRKLGCPWQPELGVGAIAEGGTRVLNEELLRDLGLDERDIEAIAVREAAELDRRVRRYRAEAPPLPLADRTVILVDDGLATGYTARAAIAALRDRAVRRVVLAVPVAAPSTIDEMEALADEVVTVLAPDWLGAIGQFYDDFRQTTDEEVVEALHAARERDPGSGSARRDEAPWAAARRVSTIRDPPQSSRRRRSPVAERT